MSDNTINSARLDDLIHMYCDKTLDEAGHRELEQLLASSDSAAERFIDVVQVWAGLMDWAEVEESHEEAEDQKQILAFPRVFPLFSWIGVTAVAATLATVFSMGLYFGSGLHVTEPQVVQQQSPMDPRHQEAPSVAGLEPQHYVARVVEVTHDVSWGDAKPEEFLLRLAEGEQVDLKTGTARIDFAGGASVLLKGPALLELLAGDAARLHRGQLTGRAEDGNFRLMTESAEVIDLGTEFGVSVDGKLNTDVCVFDGEVNINVGDGSARREEVSPVRLTQGMAVRVQSDGSILESFAMARSGFQRHSSRIEPSENVEGLVSLADLVAGGNGRSLRVAGAIDPRSGDWDSEVLSDPELVRNRYGDTEYKLCEASPYIDGVFIPTNDGLGTQLDSAGDAFDLGRNDGMTWGPIWSRMHIPNLRSASGGISDFWGTDTLHGILDMVEMSKYGVVGMHPNVGMTIDLRAIRTHIGRLVTRFQSEIANLDNSATRRPDYAAEHRPSVDFSVFVDGKLEYVRGHFAREEGIVAIDISLPPDARFLTLVSTDACNSFSFDHFVLIDPVLLFERP